MTTDLTHTDTDHQPDRDAWESREEARADAILATPAAPELNVGVMAEYLDAKAAFLNGPPPAVPGVAQRIAEISSAVKAAIDAVDPAAPMDAIIALHGYCGTFKREAAEWGKLAEVKFVECLQAHGTEERPAQTNVGEIRFYVGTDKKVKCNDNGETASAILDATGGDFAKLAGCMSANAFKYGQVREVVGDAKFAELFTTDEKSTLEEGKPDKKLKVVNQAFLR